MECSKDSSSKRPGSDWSICSSFWRDGNLDSSSCAKGTWAHENFCSSDHWRRRFPFTLTSPCHWHQTGCYRLVPHGANVCTARKQLLTGRPQVLLILDIKSLSLKLPVLIKVHVVSVLPRHLRIMRQELHGVEGRKGPGGIGNNQN